MDKTKNRYCLPIISEDKQQVLKELSESIKDYGYFEIWVDYIQCVDEKFIEALATKYEEKIIFLFRRLNLDKVLMGWKMKTKIINVLKNTKSSIDLDIFNQRRELNYIKREEIKVNKIVSYHNYKETPSILEIHKIARTMEKYDPDIYKIATKCEEEIDALKLLKVLLALRKKKKRFIVSGMGEMGMVTRIFGPLWGNELIFAPRRSNKLTAPGQLTKKQLETIYKEVK